MAISVRYTAVRPLAVVLSAILALALSGCGDKDKPAPAPTKTSTSAAPSSTPEVEEIDYTQLPDGLPEAFPDIGLPFYQPATLMASPNGGYPWIAEFETEDSLVEVNRFYGEQFDDDTRWPDLRREIEGELTLYFVTTPDYDVTVAVRPDFMDESKTAFIYTLRELEDDPKKSR